MSLTSYAYRKAFVFVIIGLFLAVSIAPVNSLRIDQVHSKSDERAEDDILFNFTFSYPVNDINNDNGLLEREDFERDLHEIYPWHYDEYLMNHSDYLDDKLLFHYPCYDDYSNTFQHGLFDDEYIRNHPPKNRNPTPKPNFADGKTWYVDDDGGADFTKIQDAIDNASEGDTVYVYSGTYYENVVVDKSIILEGEGRNTTVIDGGGGNNNDVMEIKANYTKIIGFLITNSSYGVCNNGILIFSDYTNISNNKIVENNGYGIHFIRSSHNIVTNNIIQDNCYGIEFTESNNNIITNNVFLNDGLLVVESYHNYISDNKVNGKPLMYLEGESNLTINEDGGQVILVDCDYITLKNQNISNTFVGIELFNSNNCDISSNNLSSNTAGMYIFNSNYNIIIKNNIVNNTMFYHFDMDDFQLPVGICLWDSIGNNILENYITGNSIKNHNSYGISIIIWLSGNNVISENIISNNSWGIWGDLLNHEKKTNNNIIKFNTISDNFNGILLTESNNTITENTIINNIWDGIRLYDSTNNNIITFNTVLKNGRGIFLDKNSDGNTIVSNTCNNNTADGIEITDDSNDNVILDCTISNNFQFGIRIEDSSGNVLSNSIIKNQKYLSKSSGISIKGSDNILIQGCHISYNRNSGILLDSFSSQINITDCSINNNGWGVFLSKSPYNKIERCTISENTNGIGEGENNTICRNNFIDNYNHYIHGKWFDTNIFFRNYWSDRLIQSPLPYRVFNLNFDWFPKAIPYEYRYLNESIVDYSANSSMDFDDQNNRFPLIEKFSDRLSALFSKVSDVLSQEQRHLLNQWRDDR